MNGAWEFVWIVWAFGGGIIAGWMGAIYTFSHDPQIKIVRVRE